MAVTEFLQAHIGFVQYRTGRFVDNGRATSEQRWSLDRCQEVDCLNRPAQDAWCEVIAQPHQVAQAFGKPYQLALTGELFLGGLYALGDGVERVISKSGFDGAAAKLCDIIGSRR